MNDDNDPSIEVGDELSAHEMTGIDALRETRHLTAKDLAGRNIDRVIGYLMHKINAANQANQQLASIRTQIYQLTAFVAVALVIGTRGLHALVTWESYAWYVSIGVLVPVALIASWLVHISNRFTEAVLEEQVLITTLYELIIFEGKDDIDALMKEVSLIENQARKKIEIQICRLPPILGSLFHSMRFYEQHSPYPEDIGNCCHFLPLSGVSGHLQLNNEDTER